VRLSPRVRRVTIAVIVLVTAYAFTTWWDFRLPAFGAARYQAVFLTNGQTFFGSYHDRLGPYAKLESVYYIQQSGGGDTVQPVTTRILKRGTELHAPETPMLIAKSAILFVEDLTDASPVAAFMTQDATK
jgi:hypothetical protein